MTPTEVLKMLKSKIDAAGGNKCNYAIETSDIEAINQALLLYDVSGSLPTDKQIELKADEYMTEIQSNAYAYDRNTGWEYSDVIDAFRAGAKWTRIKGNDR